MGIWNKVKGIFMEEVEEEVDEPTRPIKKVNDKSTVAKKIETPEPVKKEEKLEEKKEELVLDRGYIDEEKEEETKEFDRPIEENTLEIERRIKDEHNFPMSFDTQDFEVIDERRAARYTYTPDEDEIISANEVEEVKEEVKEEVPEKPVQEEPVLYHERRIDREVRYEVEEPVKVEPYELNGQKEKKQGFQRSPIISPVYGILDKNYRKEEIVTKREIRLTTNNKKADLDLVREKAYGELANDITESINEEVIEEKKEPVEKDNLLYDLSENAQPSVSKITVGDAEEYFNDLGLEYNVDYKVEKDDTSAEEETIVEEKTEEPVEEVKPKIEAKEEDETDDELFSLIDEMYN